MTDLMHAITDAEATIAKRIKEREGMAVPFRGPLAAEMIADELTRLVAEVRTFRYLYAGTQAVKR